MNMRRISCLSTMVAILIVLGVSKLAAQVNTNCCDNCFPPYPASYSVVIEPGFNLLANVLCRRTNTLSALLTNAPDGAVVYKWDAQTQDYDLNAATYTAFSGEWFPDLTLALGEGFALFNPGNPYTNTFFGCEPDCPLPCNPTNNACQILGAPGPGPSTWTNLYSCPPTCGTTLRIWNVGNQDWDTYTYLNGSWSPVTPYWGVGLAVKVCVQANANCLSCSNELRFTCGTNKTVECGSAWTFDAVTATNDCCSNNITITVQSTITNVGSCASTHTRTWLIADCSTNSITCTQTVTEVDTTLPAITSVPVGSNLGCNPLTLPTDASIQAQVLATDNCSTPTVNVSHVDGGTACAKTRTFTVTATDTCGNVSAPLAVKYSWIEDTTPPVAECPTDFIMSPQSKPKCLNKVRIPRIEFKATDNCSPHKDLTFSQVPAANTEVTGRAVVVAVTVTDRCGNATTCPVTVVAYDRTPPVLELDRTHLEPKGPLLTLTNCELPNLLPFASATDECGCPVVIEQIPAAGTVVRAPNPPAHSVKVTLKATDCVGNVTTETFQLALKSSGVGSQSSNQGLQPLAVWNTGVDQDGNLLAPGTPDLHYQLIEAPLGYSPWPATPTAVPANSPWGALGSSISGWIAPVTAPDWDSSACPPGVYHYQATFVLPQFVDPDTATIHGRWAADNDAEFFFNGASVDNILHPQNHDGWSSWHTFSFAKPKNVGAGNFLAYPDVNTLDFYVTNLSASATGLRVELTGLSECGVCDPPVIVFITDSQRIYDNDKMGNTLEVEVSGTPPMTYQWYHNNVALTEQPQTGPYHGVQKHRLVVKYSGPSGPLLTDLAGMYTVVVSNECGYATASTMLTVQSKKPPKPGTLRLTPSIQDGDWAGWRFDDPEYPLAGNPGPALLVQGSNTMAMGFGSTEDFGVSSPLGFPVRLLDLPALPPDTTIRLPAITDSNLTSYTLLFDVYSPSNSSGLVRTLFANQGSTNGGFTWTIDAQNHLRLSGAVGGTDVTAVSSATVPPETWSRLGLVVDITEGEPSLQMYFNGQPDGFAAPAASGDPIPGLDLDLNSSNRAALILSSTTGDNAPLLIAGVFLQTVALAPQLVATYDGPDAGPLIERVAISSLPPLLSLDQTAACLNLIWTGDQHVLQETTDLNSNQWRDSILPFIAEDINGAVRYTACVTPPPSTPRKFFRLTVRP